MAQLSTAQLIKKTQKLFEEEKYQEIIDILSDVILEKHGSAALYARVARAYDRKYVFQPDTVFKYAYKALELDDSIPETHLAIGNALLSKKEYYMAIAEFNKAISLDSEYGMAYNNLGVALKSAKQYSEAIGAHDRSISLDPNVARRYLSRGYCWKDMGELSKAKMDFDKVISLAPDDAEGYLAYADMFMQEENYEKALSYFDKAISLDSSSAAAFNNRGACWWNMGDYRRAEADYIKAISVNPKGAQQYANLGKYYRLISKDNVKAIEQFNKAIEFTTDEESRNQYVFLRDQALEGLKEEIESTEVIVEKDEVEKLFEEIATEIENILRLAKYTQKDPVVHYTKLSVADVLISKEAKLRYYNVLYMNDPSEGEVLFDCFSERKTIRDAFERGRRQVETSVYLGCFLINTEDEMHEDELVMWRTYGKDNEGREAAGCSLVIESNFFDKEDKGKDGVFVKAMERETQALYSVIYFKAGKFHDSQSKMASSIKQIEKSILKLVSLSTDQDAAIIDKRIFEALSEICHLIKSSDYAFEHEVRVVQYMPLGTTLIKVDEMVEKGQSPRLYIESNKSALPHIQKVYVGPKVLGPNNWMAYLDYKVRRSKNEDSIKYPLKLHRSVCRFQ